MDFDEEMIKEINEAMDMYSVPDKSTCVAPGTRYELPTDHIGHEHYHVDADSDDGARAAWDKLNRAFLINATLEYRSDKYFGPEQATIFCIGPRGHVSCYKQSSSGYSWIGVNVNDTICVVTTSDPIRKRPANKTQLFAYYLLKSAVADMLGDMPVSTRTMLPQRFHSVPVAVVSVAPCALGGQEEFQDADKAINFLRQKLNGCSSLSTEQMAVCALSYLMGQEFNPKKIEVCGWGNGSDGVVLGMTKECVLQAINTCQE